MSARRSAALLLAAAAALAAAVAAAYGVHDGLVTFALLAATGALGLVAGALLVARRERLGGLRRQFAIGGTVVVAQAVLAVLAGALLMFVSAHDAVVLVVLVVFAGLVASSTARVVARGVMADIDSLRTTLEAVGEGSREPDAATNSRDELAELAVAANIAIQSLDGAERAQRSLVAAVSHDLRTPITSLQLLAEAVGDDIVDEATRR
ncbi:MAG TPA: histidine kinase dimerization/phospho-acceptor domain-containing protein, partial [Solirubrobacteraceae bacterium]|nr:histidine kinase dimerization/phospho-acceptor domain-containing protein [Solirubrobacteraceae bacterium]